MSTSAVASECNVLPSIDNTGNNLLINRGNGTFTSEEQAYGVRDGGWGWAAALVELDNEYTCCQRPVPMVEPRAC